MRMMEWKSLRPLSSIRDGKRGCIAILPITNSDNTLQIILKVSSNQLKNALQKRARLQEISKPSPSTPRGQHLLLLTNQELHSLYCRVLKKIRTPCLYCGRITAPSMKQRLSTNMQKNLIQIIS